jgi:hypothetical protein
MNEIRAALQVEQAKEITRLEREVRFFVRKKCNGFFKKYTKHYYRLIACRSNVFSS